ncbi:MAG TPA: response regulator transcription factor [Mycobacteriales bacterium]|nr:response regulator transcription factor [Mycobacteriales bacterium]
MRVLVIEDERRMLALLRRGLVEEGYAVDVAEDGREGLWMASEVDYAAVICDVMLPSLDGFEVCREMRRAGRWAPVILLTARDAVEDRVRGLDAGADDYLTKPFSFAELAARVRALVRRGAVERPAAIEVGDLVVDTVAHTVTRAGVEVSLSAKELAMLELFARHPDEVLTRSRILEHVWDFAFDPASNIVDQYVGYLRRKIDKPFGRNDLQTVRGAGYRLRASHGSSS